MGGASARSGRRGDGDQLGAHAVSAQQARLGFLMMEN
jgi:hypothetical protein